MLRTSRFASRLIPRSSARFFSTKPPTDTASTASTAASAEVVIEHTSPSPLDETDGKVSSLLELQMSLRAALSTSDFSAATTLSDQIIAQTSTLFPPTDPHPALARAYNDNGYVHKAVGSHHLAIESYHKAIQLYRDSVGPTSSGYAQALGNVSVCYREYASVLGKEEGESEVESEKMESGLLARSKEAAESAVNASEAHINKIEAAMEEYKNDPDPEPEMEKYQYTDEHLLKARKESIHHMSLLGSALTSQGYALMQAGGGKKKASRVAKSILGKAEDILRRCVSACNDVDGTDVGVMFSHEFTASETLCNALNSLGLQLKLKGQVLDKREERVEAFKEAEVCYRKALQSRCRRLKYDHDSVIKTLYNLHELYESRGKSLGPYAQGVRNIILTCKGLVFSDEGEVEELDLDLEGYNPSDALDLMLSKVQALDEGATIAEMDAKEEELNKMLTNMGKDITHQELAKVLGNAHLEAMEPMKTGLGGGKDKSLAELEKDFKFNE